jgi:hypothetical protein
MEGFFEISENKFAEVTTYRGKDKLDIREWYTDRNTQELKRTRKGVQLTAEEWDDFKARWEEFKEYVDEQFGKKLESNGK